MLQGAAHKCNALPSCSQSINIRNVLCNFSLNFVQLMEFNEMDFNDRLQRGSNVPHEMHNFNSVKLLVAEILKKLSQLTDQR